MKGCLSALTVAVSLTLLGCDRAPKTYSAACATPLPHWGTEKDGIGHLLTVLPVFLASDGYIIWNKAVISKDRLRAYMSEASGLNPLPQIVLEVSPSTSCARVHEVRSIMDEAPICKAAHHRCSEGWNPNEWPLVGGP